MKLGVNTLIWAAEFGTAQLPLLPLIREHGFDGAEVPLFQIGGFPASEVRRGFEASGLECTTCSVLLDGLNLISDDSATRARTVAHLRDVIRTAAEVGARMLAGPLYSPLGFLPGRRRTADEWSRAVDGFRQLRETLRSHDVTLAIEPLNRFETYFLNTAADAARLCDEIGDPNIGVLFDTFHANIEEKDIAAGYRTVGPHLKHVHTCENDRGTPGSGHLEWASVFEALRDVRYDGWLTIESFGFALPEIAAAAAIWRDIESTPDEVAWEGIRFLRDQLRKRSAN